MSTQVWTVTLERIEVRLPVGIYPHEKTPQRIWVDAHVKLPFDKEPASIEDCFNYETIHAHVTKTWPARGHTDLLETLVLDLLKHIFASDARVTHASVSLTKPDIFPEAAGSRVSLSATRQEMGG